MQRRGFDSRGHAFNLQPDDRKETHLKTFNAVQIVALIACAPFLIGWLHKGPFPYSTAIMWAAGAAYIVGLVVEVAAIRQAMD